MRGTPYLAAFLALAFLGSAAAAQTPNPEGPFEVPHPEVRFPAVEPLVEALAVDESAASLIDAFWQPAIDALVAANPQRADQARAFAADLRARELAVYRPLVASSLDRETIPLLYSATQRRPDAKQVNAHLERLARLARSEDGRQLTALLRKGYFACVPRLHRATDAAECETLAASPPLQRLRSRDGGEDLILVAAAAYRNLVAMMQLGHAAGISLHRLLPPDSIRAAGLVVPEDQGVEQLLASSSPKATR